MSEQQLEITDRQKLVDLDKEFLDELARNVLNHLRMPAYQISIVLVDNAEIQLINNKYLQHDFSTDVITFPLNDLYFFPDQPDRKLEGEIIISTEMAIDQARSIGWKMDHELALYLIHGLLHLCGFDDLNEQDQQAMRIKEKEILIAANISPHPNDPRWQNLD